MSQTSPVVLCMQNNVISIRITSLYGSQPLSVVFACKTATFGSELQVSMGPRLHLRFFAFKTAPLAPELQVSMGPSRLQNSCSTRITFGFQTSPVVLSMQNNASELIVSMGPRPHQNYTSTSLWVPRPHLSFCACKTTNSIRITSLMGPSPHLWFLQN